jgi:hypothetical protein
MKRVQRSAILSSVSRKASQYENYVVNTIDNHARSERREQAPVKEPNYYPKMEWDAKSRQITRSWTF